MNSESKYFKLFAECKLVKGNKRSAIYDLPRNSYKLIPNGLYDILSTYKTNTIDDIKRDFDKTQHSIINEYFKMLIENEFIFFCDEDELELFVDLEPVWDYPGQVSNAILELPMLNESLVKSLLSLEKLGCRFIQFRSFETLDLNYVGKIMYLLKDKDFDYVEIISKRENESIEDISLILNNNQRLRAWYFHGAKENRVIKNNTVERQKIVLSKEKKTAHSDFYVNGKFYFNVNIMLFFESLNFNNYYNRKVCINKLGEVKNCLSLEKSFGKVTNLNTIKDIVQTDSFQSLWFINNDKIEVCQDCEFRYMCVDNTPIKNNKGKWLKIRPCFYNPYNPNNKVK